MRLMIVALGALGVVVGVATVARAAPPQDLETYCAAMNPERSAQVRCLGAEKGSQDRLARAQGAIEPSVWTRCHSASASWASMEACVVAQPNVSAPAAAAPLPGVVPPPAPAVPTTPPAAALPGVVPPAAPAVPSTPPPATPLTEGVPPAAAVPGVVPPSAAVPSAPGAALPGVVPPAAPPVPSAPPAAASPPEPARPSRAISEAEAERQLQDVLRRMGPAAHCTKKQYGNGWAIVCE